VLPTGRSLGTVTSSDGGGSAPDDPHANLLPPADPWLTEAPTSFVGDPAPSYPALADTAPYGTPSPGWDARRPRRRARRWIVAVLVACALFIAGMLAIDPFGSGDDTRGAKPTAGPTGTGAAGPAGGARTTGTGTGPAGGAPSAGATTSRQPDSSAGAAAPGTSANASVPQVVYEVTASGSHNTGSVVYTDQDGTIIRRHGIPLPWRTAFPVDGRRNPLILDAQRKRGGDAGPVTCTITVDGKLISSTTAEGRYAAPECVGSRR